MPSHCVEHGPDPLGVEDCPACLQEQVILSVVYTRALTLLQCAQDLLDHAGEEAAATEVATTCGGIWAGYQQPLDAWIEFQQFPQEERQAIRARAARWSPTGWSDSEATDWL